MITDRFRAYRQINVVGLTNRRQETQPVFIKIHSTENRIKIEYSQNKELGNDLLLYLLLNHYSLKKQETIKLLFNKLPDNLSYTQKKYKIQNLLTKLRKQGKILK